LFKTSTVNSNNTELIDNITNLNDFIYLKENILTKEFCKEIIDFYENHPENHYDGVILRGYEPDIKNTKDFSIDPEFNEISKKIYDELNKKLSINIKYYLHDKSILNTINKFVQYDGFMIQKYFKNIGRYIYHHDFLVDYINFRYRICAFIFYLNDVSEGGETEFWFGKYKIQPKTGSLLIFPSAWCYPHCGKMPISNDKYIVTGWIFINENIFINETIDNLIELNKNNNLSDNEIKKYNIKDINIKDIK